MNAHEKKSEVNFLKNEINRIKAEVAFATAKECAELCEQWYGLYLPDTAEQIARSIREKYKLEG